MIKTFFHRIKKVSLFNRFLIGAIVLLGTSLGAQMYIQNEAAHPIASITSFLISPTPTALPSPTPSPTVMLTPTITPTPMPTAVPTPTAPPVNNTAPSAGVSTQYVQTSGGTFQVVIIAADLNSTKVVVDTASDGDCTNNCPVLPLASYAARSNAYAGINGSFFCPTEYPSCAGKTNSFDTLLMNKNKTYFNSANNVYSTVPLIYFTGSTMGVRGQSLEWGRDTGVDGVIANFPLYVAGGKSQFGGSSDPKINSKGTRTFVGNKGSTGYMGIVYSASAADAASVLATLGLDNALGLDQGGSTALWYNGSYLAGPGRSIPNAVLFLHK